MRKIITLLVCGVLSFGTAAAAPSIPSLVRTLRKSSCMEMTKNRIWAMYQMQNYMDSTSNKQFQNYLELEDPAARRQAEKGTVMYFYQDALEKLVKEIPATKVEKGTVAVWLLYNMGYVIKTPSHCFAIDLSHPEADRLVPYLEFLMITHDHDDHYTDKMNKAMIAAGKKVYSNFDVEGYALTNIREEREIDLGDIKFRTEITDHNKKYRQFVITYLIDCGEDTGHTTIYHVGDSCYYDQLNPSWPVDIFIPHLQVGLKIDKAAANIQPNWVLMSHVLELGHAVDRFRWTYMCGLNEAHQVHRKNVFVPIWGEKVIYRKTGK